MLTVTVRSTRILAHTILKLSYNTISNAQCFVAQCKEHREQGRVKEFGSLVQIELQHPFTIDRW